MMFPMHGAAQGAVCPRCGSTKTGSFFCRNCSATLRPVIPLIPPADPQIGLKLPRWKRIVRGLIKTIAALAGIIVIFDNQANGLAGILLIGSVAVLLLSFLGWRVLDLGEDDLFWRKRATTEIKKTR
jgi:hypothetical protein